MDTELVRKLKILLNYSEQGSDVYEQAAKELKEELGSIIFQLKQLIEEGPVYDGDIISKQARDELIELDLAIRVCCKGEQGYTAATYLGWDIFNADTH